MTDVTTKVKVDLNLQEPPLFQVVYLNDETTTMEFVVNSLMEFFSYTLEQAIERTNEVHTNGSAVAATLPYEIAEQISSEIVAVARESGFPLNVKAVPEIK